MKPKPKTRTEQEKRRVELNFTKAKQQTQMIQKGKCFKKEFILNLMSVWLRNEKERTMQMHKYFDWQLSGGKVTSCPANPKWIDHNSQNTPEGDQF